MDPQRTCTSVCLAYLVFISILYTLSSFPYQPRYKPLSWALRQDPSQCDIDPLTPFPGSRALLNEFQEDGISLSPEEALDYLLGAAINRFGYSARDVFQAVFHYQSSVQRQQHHQAAFERRMADLEGIFRPLSLSSIPRSQLGLF